MARCKECIRNLRKEEYASRADQIKERVARYRADNYEKVKEADRAYRQSDKGVANRRANYHKNIEKHREGDRRRSDEDWFRRKASHIKSKCKIKGIEYDLSPEWLEKQFELQQGRCYWTGVEMDCSNKLFRPSVDRLIVDGGYTQDNVVLTTYFCNIGRGNASQEDMEQMAKVLKSV